jgi:uncharacterized MAPEG superfamily protein
LPLPFWSLLGFVAWTIGIVLFGIAVPRVSLVLRRRARPTDFPTDVPHGPERYRRLMRAHANAVENLPLLLAVVLVAAHLGVQDRTFDLLAVAILPARVVQTLAHVSSGSARAVLVRATFYAVQMLCIMGMLAIVVLNATR